MIRAVAAKEFLTCLLTYRFALALAASVVLMAASAFVLRADYAKRLDEHHAELARIQADLEDITFYARLEVTASRPPSPLSVFAEGLEKRLGTILRFSYAKVPTMLTWKKEANPLLAAFPPFDLATVAGLLFSLMALFFAFDAISGEHEGNTLKLMMANRVARWQILLGKWIGGGACALVPAVAGFVTATLVVTSSPRIDLSAAEWLRVALILATVLVYTSAFFVVGLALSARSDRSGTSLSVCIALWASCTIVVPTTVGYVVGELVLLPAERELQAQRDQLEATLMEDYGKRLEATMEEFALHMGDDYGNFGPMTTYAKVSVGNVVGVRYMYREAIPFLTRFYEEFEPRRIACGGDIAELEDRLVRARGDQQQLARLLGRPFVTPAFRNAVAALAATDLASFEGFIAHARRHRSTLVDWMREQGMFTSVLFFSSVPEERLLPKVETNRRYREKALPGGWGVDPVDTGRVPRLPDFQPDMHSLLGGAAADLALLLAANPLVFFLALRWFAARQVG